MTEQERVEKQQWDNERYSQRLKEQQENDDFNDEREQCECGDYLNSHDHCPRCDY